MKNITVSIDDETYRKTRIMAAERELSVSALVREQLQKLAARPDDDWAASSARLIEILNQSRGFNMADRLTREEMYVRGRRP